MVDIIKRLIKRNKIFYYLVCIGFEIYGRLVSLLCLVMRIFPIKKNKIVCCNMKGKRYGDNPKYIVDEIIRQKLDYDIVWLMKDAYDVDLPKEIRKAKYNILSIVYELATAKFWIDSNTKPYGILKRKNQYYIQTWHGFLKKLYADIPDKINFFDEKYVKHNSKIEDIMVSSSSFTTDVYTSAFWYKGEILECGSPRNDIFFEDPEKYIENVRNFFKIKDKKIALYAPTYREDFRTDEMHLNFERLLKCLRQKFGGEWVVLVRLHPHNMMDAQKFMHYTDEIINATDYSVMQELLVASDILISDYSSCMLDFVTKKAPCFIYATDVQKYKAERDLYFDVHELPFPLAESNEEMENNILNFNNDKYMEDLGAFFDKIKPYDKGNSCRQLVEWIVSHT